MVPLGEVGGKVTNQVKSRPEPGARQRKVNSTLNLDPQNKLFEKDSFNPFNLYTSCK